MQRDRRKLFPLLPRPSIVGFIRDTILAPRQDTKDSTEKKDNPSDDIELNEKVLEMAKKWLKNSNPDMFEQAMNEIAPPGKKLRKDIKRAYARSINEETAIKWAKNYIKGLKRHVDSLLSSK